MNKKNRVFTLVDYRPKDDLLLLGTRARSHYAEECIELLETLVEREGWDFVYEKLVKYKYPGPDLYEAER